MKKRIKGRPLLMIFGTWVITQFFFWKMFGLRMGGDTGRYLGGAQQILEGLPLTGEQWHYLAYQGLLAAVLAWGGEVRTVALTQCLLTLGGAVGLYVLGRRMFSETVGLLASIIFLLHPSIQRWNFYILTESLATNLLILAAALSLTANEGKTIGVLLLPVGTVLALTRPEAPIFLLPIIFFLLKGRSPLPFLIGSYFLAFFAVLCWIRPSQPSDFGVWHHWSEGTYIWGYPGIGPPRGAVHYSPSPAKVSFGVRELLKDLPWLVKLMALRAFYFFSPTRPYFSFLHNTVAVVVAFPLYALGVVGTFAQRSKGKMFLWSFVILQGVLAVLTWSDWDNRWLDRVTPFLLVLAVGGSVEWYNLYKTKREPTLAE